MDKPLIIEDSEGRQYIEASWVIDKLQDIDSEIRSMECLKIEQITDFMREIEASLV